METHRRFGFRPASGDGWRIEPRFDEAQAFFEGLAAVRIGLRWGYIGRDGEMVIEPRFVHAGRFNDGMASTNEGFIDPRGQVAFLRRQPTADGRYAYLRSGTQAWDSAWGYRDAADHRVVIEARFGIAGEFHDGHAVVARWVDGEGARYGVIDRDGEIVIPLDWEFTEMLDADWDRWSFTQQDGSGDGPTFGCRSVWDVRPRPS